MNITSENAGKFIFINDIQSIHETIYGRSAARAHAQQQQQQHTPIICIWLGGTSDADKLCCSPEIS